MRYSNLLIASAVIFSCALPAAAADPAKPSSAKPMAAKAAAVKPLNFRDLGGVKGWRAGDKDTVVYVQVQDSAWYRVDLYETCMKFVNDKGLRFITEEDDTGDMVSKVVADKYICQVLEMTKVDAPPPAKPPTSAP